MEENTLPDNRNPEEIYGELFNLVQLHKVFPDYKTFPDCMPLSLPNDIIEAFNANKDKVDFNLPQFVQDHFKYPETNDFEYKTDFSLTIVQHIESLWYILTRRPQLFAPNFSLMSLPNSYVIPGGRFIEIFYWDSYFIMLGLQLSGKEDLMKNMLDNFCYQLTTLGFIPNGNRTYFLSRSQPPMFAMMAELAIEKDPPLLVKYLPFFEIEYAFWMDGIDQLNEQNNSCKRVVQMSDGSIMNRYWDSLDTPRPEAYGKDLSYAHKMNKEDSAILYRNIRAACESGWDFTSRFYKDEQTIQTIHTIDIVPIDLNCLLHYLEDRIANGYEMKGQQELADHYFMLADKRKASIMKYCWSEENQFFMDYDFVEGAITPSFSMASVFPLYFNLATQEQAEAVALKLKEHFLKDGGFITTLKHTDFQWDCPNGWAPLQWLAIIGLRNYQLYDLAEMAASRWMWLNEKVYQNTGKLMEKYNVVDMNSLTGGGEYPLQDGFGWTNGVYLSLKKFYPGEVKMAEVQP